MKSHSAIVNETTPLVQVRTLFDKEESQSDDAVLHAMKRLVDGWISTIFLWFISFLFVMIHVITDKSFPSSFALLFIPMWAGSIYGILSLVLVTKELCSVSNLVTDEEVDYMHDHGEESNPYDYILYDSLPLLRYYFFYAAVSGLSLVLICTSQVLMYLWAVEGIIGMWTAVSPVLTLGSLLVLCQFATKALSITSATVLSLLLLECILAAVKVHGDPHIAWVEIIAPLTVAQTILLYQLGQSAFLYLRGVYMLSTSKKLCLLGYICSVVISMTAEAVAIVQEGAASPSAHVHTAEIMWLIAVGLFMLCGVVVMREDCFCMVNRRCFSSPLPLVHTSAGWVVQRPRRTWLVLVGAVEVKLGYQ